MPFGYWRCNYRMRGCNPFNVNSDLISLQNGFWLLERTTTKWVLVSFLQDAQVLEIDFLQNDPCQPFYMGLKATHFVVEMGMGISVHNQKLPSRRKVSTSNGLLLEGEPIKGTLCGYPHQNSQALPSKGGQRINKKPSFHANLLKGRLFQQKRVCWLKRNIKEF